VDVVATTTPPRRAPRTRALRVDALRNRERIVAAARDLFTEVGRQAPIDEVARRAGIGNATVYRHFPDRDALLTGLGDHVNAQLGDIPPDLDDARALGDAMARVFASFDAHEPTVRGLLSSPGGAELRSHARERRLARIDPLVRAALAGREHAEHARAVILLLCSLPAWQMLRDDAGLDGPEAAAAVRWAIDTLLEETT
jgi:AcrR family transcriptional regulator